MKSGEAVNKGGALRALSVRSLALCALLCALEAAASASGGRPGEIFNFGAGAKPLAMGGAYTAASADASAVYYNPSGLGMLSGRNAALMHSTLFDGDSYEYLGYAQNFAALPGGWGLQVLRLSAASAEGRDEFNEPSSAFTYSETAFSGAAGLRGIFLPMLSIGAAAKVTSRALGNSSDRLMGADLGLQYGPFARGKLNFGLALQNALSFSSGDTSDKLKPAVKIGAAYSLLPGVGFVADISDAGEFRLGTEYAIGPGALRLGYDREAVSFGGGVTFSKAYQFDVAVLRNEALGMSTRFSLNYYFGGINKPPKSRTYAVNYLAEAEKALKAGDYVKALENVDMAEGMDFGVRNGPWGEKQARLSVIVKDLRLKELPQRQAVLKTRGEQSDEANRAVKEYLDGNNLKSSLLAHSALGYSSSEPFYEELLALIARLTSSEIRKDEVLPRTAMLQEKLKKAASAFYEQRFESALRQCEEVLLLDDKDSIAWTRLGSVYYAMGEREKARKAYEKAVALDPTDSQTIEFMKMQGWR